MAVDPISAHVANTFARLKDRPNLLGALVMTTDGEVALATPGAVKFAGTIMRIVHSLSWIVERSPVTPAASGSDHVLTAAQADSATVDMKAAPEHLTFTRLRTTRRSYLIAPGAKYIFAVIEALIPGNELSHADAAEPDDATAAAAVSAAVSQQGTGDHSPRQSSSMDRFGLLSSDVLGGPNSLDEGTPAKSH